MLKVKKTIRNPKNKSQDDNLTEVQNNIKNYIKNLYISDQKKKKTINAYAEFLTKVRKEYAKLQKEKNELKTEFHRYRNCFQNIPQKSNQKPSYTKLIRKVKHYYYDETAESEQSTSYVTEIRRRPKKKKENNIQR